MLTKSTILNGGGYPNTYIEYSNIYMHNGGYQGTMTAWETGRPINTLTGKNVYPAPNHFTQDYAMSVLTGLNFVDMNAPDSAALGDLYELQKDATEKAGYLSGDGATWLNKAAYTGEVTETTAEIDILKTLMSGQTTHPAGTGSQPEGTQPDKAAGLNPLIVVAGVAAVGLAALALRGKA